MKKPVKLYDFQRKGLEAVELDQQLVFIIEKFVAHKASSC